MNKIIITLTVIKQGLIDLAPTLKQWVIHMSRQLSFEHNIANHHGERNFDGISKKLPRFYALMEVEGGFQWVSDEKCDDGVAGKQQCYEWAKANYQFRKAQGYIR